MLSNFNFYFQLILEAICGPFIAAKFRELEYPQQTIFDTQTISRFMIRQMR